MSGAYYTPAHVLDRIEPRVIDPACGTGGFLAATVEPLDVAMSNPPWGTR